MNGRGHTDLMLSNISSFEDFFRKNYHVACLVALRYLKNEQEAEDIVQETFLYLWEKRRELEVQRNLKQYLFQAVKNRSINYIQREKQIHQSAEVDFNQIEDSADDFSNEELAVKISRSIESLPPQCKKIFTMAYMDNLTYIEIADTLHLSKNTIKTQMGIAYKILRNKLKKYFLYVFFCPIRLECVL